MATTVEIGFDLAPNGVGNWFTLDNATKGKLDGTTYKLSGDVLTDVTSSVRSVSIKRGRSRQLEKFTAATTQVVLDNRNRYFDPLYGPTVGGTRTNLVTNPNFEVGTAGWAVVGVAGMIARDTTQARFGAASVSDTVTANGGANPTYFVRTVLNIPPGQPFTFSFYAKANRTASASAYINFLDAGNALVGQAYSGQVSISSAAWQRVSCSLTAPAGTSYVQVYAAMWSANIGDIFWMDAALLEQSPTLNPYFDGTYADPSISVNSQAWNGTANASTSTLVWNSDPGSPYYGNIGPRKALRIATNGTPIWRGNVEDWDFDYTIGGDSTATVKGVDGFALLAKAPMSAGTMTSQLTGARIGTVLNTAGWDANQRAIGAGAATLDADVLKGDETVLAYLQKVETSEPGALFMGSDGAVTFRDRTYSQAYVSGVVFGPGAIPFEDMSVVFGTEEQWNTVNVTYSAGSVVGGTVTAIGTASVASYGAMEQTYDTLLATAGAASSLAAWQVTKYADPTWRVDSVTVNMNRLTTAQQTQIVNLDLADVVQVSWTPNNIGSAVTQYVSIDAIEHNIGPVEHRVTFTLSETMAAFLLNSPVFGKLNSGILGF